MAALLASLLLGVTSAGASEACAAGNGAATSGACAAPLAETGNEEHSLAQLRLAKAGSGRRLGETPPPPTTKEPFKILFTGNSFTYGPPPYDRPDQLALNNLPRLFKLVAESLGKPVIQEEDTIGGCTLLTHLPSRNPEACSDPVPCEKVDHVRFPRVNDSAQCTMPPGINPTKQEYHPCPQTLMRQRHGAWDVIVVQDISYALYVKGVRETYTNPAIKEFAQVARSLGTRQGKTPLIALYMPWAYLNGQLSTAPPGIKAGCFPIGDPAVLAVQDPNWREKTKTFACQGYANAQGAASSMAHGGDVLVPAGLAWQMARGADGDIPAECKKLVDKEYGMKPPLNLSLPLAPSDPSLAMWSGEERGKELYRDKGPNYTSSKYCRPEAENCHVDHHASAEGMYLNALVFFATLFKQSPKGAAIPDGQTVDGMVMPTVSKKVAEALQQIAHDTVMGHMDTWWAGR